MARKFLTAVDLAKNELQNAAVQSLGSAPATPAKFQLYGNTTDNILYWWDGAQWIAAKAAAGATPAATVTTQAVGDAGVVGVSTNFAREDHKHGREAFAAVTAQTSFGAASSNGVATTLVRSDHVHGTPTHDNTAHAAINLSALAAPTADVNWGNFKITSLGAPITSTDATNKAYVDNAIAGISWKIPCEYATTANTTLSGNQTVDGVALTGSGGWNVLVKNQTDQTQNGVYITKSGAWTRRSDLDLNAEFESAAVFVTAGNTQSDTGWVQTVDFVNLGVTPVTWVQFAGGGSITAGTGLTQVGNTINAIAGDTSLTVAADDIRVNTAVIATVASLGSYVPTTRSVIAGAGLTGGGALSADATVNVIAGDTSLTVAADDVRVNTSVIATVASLASYVPTTRTLATTAPLTGGGDLSANRTLDISTFTATVKGAVPPPTTATGKFLKDDGTWAAAGTINKFSQATIGGATSQTVTHNLNSQAVVISVFRTLTPWEEIECDIEHTTVNTATLRFTVAPATNEFTCVVVG